MCTWCGSVDHLSDQHLALGRRADWWLHAHPFRDPGETCGSGLEVTLGIGDIAAATGRAEHIVSVDVGRGWAMYFDPGGEDRLSVNIRGFGAELAASYASGLAVNWDYLPSHYRRARKPPDLGRRTEVRNARSHRGRLWASKHDPISRVFLLVTGIMPSFRVRGWLEGAELKVPERHLEPPAVRYEGYFAEPDELNPLPLPEDA